MRVFSHSALNIPSGTETLMIFHFQDSQNCFRLMSLGYNMEPYLDVDNPCNKKRRTPFCLLCKQEKNGDPAFFKDNKQLQQVQTAAGK